MSGMPHFDFTPIFQLMIVGLGAVVGLLLMFLLTGISLLFWLPFNPLWGLMVPVVLGVIAALLVGKIN